MQHLQHFFALSCGQQSTASQYHCRMWTVISSRVLPARFATRQNSTATRSKIAFHTSLPFSSLCFSLPPGAKPSDILQAEETIRSNMRALEGVQAPPNILAGFQTVDTKRSGTYQLSVHPYITYYLRFLSNDIIYQTMSGFIGGHRNLPWSSFTAPSPLCTHFSHHTASQKINLYCIPLVLIPHAHPSLSHCYSLSPSFSLSPSLSLSVGFVNRMQFAHVLQQMSAIKLYGVADSALPITLELNLLYHLL
jgi:hypothetical protein